MELGVAFKNNSNCRYSTYEKWSLQLAFKLKIYNFTYPCLCMDTMVPLYYTSESKH